MAERYRRCAYEQSRFSVRDFKVMNDFLVHIDPGTGEPIYPAHEALEGRLLKKVEAAGYELETPMAISDPMALPD
jgi:hypothetical protein